MTVTPAHACGSCKPVWRQTHTTEPQSRQQWASAEAQRRALLGGLASMWAQACSCGPRSSAPPLHRQSNSQSERSTDMATTRKTRATQCEYHRSDEYPAGSWGHHTPEMSRQHRRAQQATASDVQATSAFCGWLQHSPAGALFGAGAEPQSLAPASGRHSRMREPAEPASRASSSSCHSALHVPSQTKLSRLVLSAVSPLSPLGIASTTSVGPPLAVVLPIQTTYALSTGTAP